MRCSEKRLPGAAAVIALCTAATVFAQGSATGESRVAPPTYRLGTTPSADEIKARDTAVSPDGRALPPGSGTVKEGAAVYAQKCVACHGPNGTGTPLHRGLIPLGNSKPVKIQGSLVPYATTVWDFINRAMPSTKPGTLTPNEVYAVTAFVLYLNDVITENDIVDATTLPKIRMPNRDNFIAVEMDLTPGQRRPLGHYPGR
jgi:S-disulfanyl-L-cysteine oxidoreductase SoxD